VELGSGVSETSELWFGASVNISATLAGSSCIIHHQVKWVGFVKVGAKCFQDLHAKCFQDKICLTKEFVKCVGFVKVGA
jgi:hypothetical protein